jgi:hypothetical protein
MTLTTILSTLSLLSFAMVPNVYAAHCSNASLRGTYAFSAQGFTEVTHDVSPAGFVPFAEIGVIVYDGKGNVNSASFTASTTAANGGSFPGTFTGKYSVNSDCRGTIVIDLGDNNLFHSTWYFSRHQRMWRLTPIPVP